MRTLWTAVVVLAFILAVPMFAVIRAWHEHEHIPVWCWFMLSVFMGILTSVLIQAALLDICP